MKKVIITGPTGAIGIALVNELIANGVQVTTICHRGSARIAHLPAAGLVEVIECNLDCIKELAGKLTADYDVFFHLAWAGTFGDSRNNVNMQLRNIQYTLDAVELAAALGCKRFVGAGSQAEYGRTTQDLNADTPTYPESGYGIAKLCAGQLSRIRCAQLGMEHIWTRILSVYGPYDGEKTLISSAISSLLRGERFSCTTGDQIWDYLYSKDAAKALLLIAEKGQNNRTYCLGAGDARPLREYIEMIRDCINSECLIGFGDIPYGEKQVMRLCADISDLKRDTGFVTSYEFIEGIRETIAWAKEYYDEKVNKKTY